MFRSILLVTAAAMLAACSASPSPPSKEDARFVAQAAAAQRIHFAGMMRGLGESEPSLKPEDAREAEVTSIACAAAADLPGWNCDIEWVMERLDGGAGKMTIRLFQVDGEWKSARAR